MYAITLDHGYLALAEPPKWEAVHARFQSLRQRRCSDDAEEARCIREGESVQIWRQLGDRNMADYLGRMLGYGPRCAYDRLRVAKALGELPQMELALERGELVYSVVRELTRVVVPETVGDWMAAARGRSLREVEGMVSGRQLGDGPDAPVKPELVIHALHFDVSAETYALFRQLRKAIEDEVGEHLDDDAFLAMLAKRGLETSTKTTPTTVTLVEGRGLQAGAGAVVELSKEALEQIECHADRQDKNGKLTRYIPANTRRAVLARDHNRCSYPSCQSPHALEVHHIKHVRDGGGPDIDNLVTLCWHHHHAHHHGLLRISVENGEVKFESVDPSVPAVAKPRPANDGIVQTAEDALVRLGFKKQEAKRFVASAIAPGGTATNLKALVETALRLSASR